MRPIRRKSGFGEVSFTDVKRAESSPAGGVVRFNFGGNRLYVTEGTTEPSLNGAVASLFVTRDMLLRVVGLEIDGKPRQPEIFKMDKR